MKEVEFVEINTNDLELIRNWRNSKEVSQFMYTDHYINTEDQLNWFSKISNKTDCKYWLIKYNNIKVGLINITDIDLNLRTCCWAFYIGDSAYRDLGIGVKAEFELIEMVFFKLNLQVLFCEVISTNLNVLNLHKKFGFKESSFNKNYFVKNNISYDVVKLSLNKIDWMKVRDKLNSIIYK
jgi:UDP-4-amino-4,6-dideoxy-N-acetyl-beta-L-altrosamine N-acetyltransferase